MTGISTLSMSTPIRLATAQTQAALTTVQSEISSGTPADLGLTLGAQTGSAISLESEVDNLNAYTNSNSSATTRLSATSNALDALLSSAQSMQSDLTSASTAGGDTTTLATNATLALQGFIGQMNTTAGGQSVFGGINTTAVPVTNYFSSTTSSAKAAVDNAFQSAFGFSQTSASASSITGPQMQSFLDNQFATLFNNGNWQSSWSSASSQTISNNIAPSQNQTTSVSANQGTFQQIAQAYTMVTEFTGQNLSADAKAAVVSTASQLMSAGVAGLTNVQASVGVAQSAVTDANTHTGAQVDVLKTSVSDLTSVDTAALSTRLTQLQTQLEASYELTSQLQSLSLVNYLK